MTHSRGVRIKLFALAAFVFVATLGVLALSYERLLLPEKLQPYLSDDLSVNASGASAGVLFGLSVLCCKRCYRIFKTTDEAGVIGFVFLFSAALSVVQLFGFIAIVNTASDTIGALSDRREMGVARVWSSEEGVLTIEGMLGAGVFERVRQFDSPISPLHGLIIDSEGGFVSEALDIARFVESHDLTVIVRKNCLSACTLVAAASRRTFAYKNSTFGYHNLYSRTPIHSQHFVLSLKLISDESWDFLKAHGVPSRLIDAAKAYGPDQTLNLSAQEMLEKGLIKGIVDADISANAPLAQAAPERRPASSKRPRHGR